jgi:formate dehydrogenase maturation protein FdhE
MTSKIARFASDFAPNLSILLQNHSIWLRFAHRIDRIFRLAPQNTNKDAKRKTSLITRYSSNVVTREKTLTNTNKHTNSKESGKHLNNVKEIGKTL